MVRAHQYLTYSLFAVFSAFLLACAMFMPFLVQAQGDELSASIRVSLLSDPQSAGLSQAELDALVEALAAEAREQGITATDILWRPSEPASFGAGEATGMADTCGNMPPILCALNDALGFSGRNLIIPLLLFFSSAALIFVLSVMIHRHRQKLHTVEPSSPDSPSGI